MPTIEIGVFAQDEPERLSRTLAALDVNTAQPFAVRLLLDGPDGALRRAVARWNNLPQLVTETRRGMAAGFNRLAEGSQANVIVLLESGSLVGPFWLDRLLEGLNADPANGLAGPSTNLGWNEQRAFVQSADSPDVIAATAERALRRYGRETRTLEPLYSLADFCYVARREVWDAIGAADETYGDGPCWEMDYNIRAARAGFRGVWVGAAYVQRLALTERRARVEAARLSEARRLYQDRFCALRLRGESQAYEPHCQGEHCPHFAPRDLIRIQLPIARDAGVHDSCTWHDAGAEPQPAVSLSVAATQAGAYPAELPLISCIMPTRGRDHFVLQSIRYFLRQDYPARELIIVDDADSDLADCLPADPRIRYVTTPVGTSIGIKRNHGCELADGSIVAQWDDDDWYAPDRLRKQAEPLLAGAAEITGMKTGVYFDLPTWEFWRSTPELHARMFVGDVHGGTLTFQRRLWSDGARYPDASLAEDAAFLRQALAQGARLQAIMNTGQYIYLRHGSNSWAFRCGEYIDPNGWQRVAEPDLPSDDRAFYAALSPPCTD